MIKLIGPAHSTDAAGKLADVLTFAKGSKGTYAKKKSDPAQPRTGLQVSTRALMKFLAEQWSLNSPAEKQTWQPFADLNQVAPYHAYIAFNATRFPNWLMPTKAFPPSTALYDRFPQTCFTRSRVASVIYEARMNAFPFPWAYLLCRSTTTGFTPSRQNVIQLFRFTTGYTPFRDTPLAPGTYYYRVMAFTDKGQPTIWHAEVSGIAT